MKVAIYSRVTEDIQPNDFLQLFEELSAHEIEVAVYEPFFNCIKNCIEYQGKLSLFNSGEELNSSFDFMISLGGDGTLLDTVILIGNKNIPVLGINFGRLGFLASIGRQELKSAVSALVNRAIVIDKRSMIHLDSNIPLFNNMQFALNEFAIHKTDISPMIKVHTYLNGEFLNTYWSDGVIVSTPTGSTGYSLSCNGPIVFPDSGSFVITPIAPHNLNLRPIIVPDTHVISFEVEGRADNFICTLDSRKEMVGKGIQLAVRKESFPLNLVRLNEGNFLQTLRTKLNWGLDTRN